MIHWLGRPTGLFLKICVVGSTDSGRLPAEICVRQMFIEG